jgi:hypothetical protein
MSSIPRCELLERMLRSGSCLGLLQMPKLSVEQALGQYGHDHHAP